ncbi:hypothetical protein VTH06DRAFT_2793 [Thermothelomyces fergusii]
MSQTHLGALVRLTPPEEDGIFWTAEQSEVARALPPPGPGAPRSRHEIDWSFGPVTVTGYVDTDTWEIGVTVSVVGISLGTIYGNLQDGVGIKVDLFVAKGEIKFYLKNGSELWVHLDLKIIFDGSFDGDYKIIGF